MSRSKQTVKAVDDVWAKLDQDNTTQSVGENDGQDMTVLFVGDGGSGKSTLLQSFLKPGASKDPKPTFALEYNFIRKKQSGSKAVSHIWELGGDIFEPKLLEIPLALKNIYNASVMICLDLSKPQNIVSSLLKWLTYIKDIVNRRMIESMEASGAKFTRADLVASNYGAEHPDKLKVSPPFVPIYVVLNKYDLFKNKSTVECKMIYQIVRFICHFHGANVVTSSSQEVALRDNFRSLFNNICFNQNRNSTLGTLSCVKLPYEVSADRAVYVHVGKDNFSLIFNLSGDQSGTNSNSKLISTEVEISNYLSSDNVSRECWNRIFELMHGQFGPPSATATPLKEVFTVHAISSSSGTILVNNHLQYEIVRDEDEEESKKDNIASSLANSEADVDAMRDQKDVQLNLYVQEMAMKEQLHTKLNQPMSSGGTGGARTGGRDRDAAPSEGQKRSSKPPREKETDGSGREGAGRMRDSDGAERGRSSRDSSADRDRDSRERSRDRDRDRDARK